MSGPPWSDGSVVRSWPMRGTLHLVAPEDLRWMLDLTAERLHRVVAGRHRELDITWADIEKCRDVALERVAGGGSVSRNELFAMFDAAGQPTTGQRGIHILGSLCRHAWLVQGPLAGNQQLLVAFDEWIPVSRTLGRQEAIAEFMLRYFRSHGPATVRDFAWWTQLPLTRSAGCVGAGQRAVGGTRVRRRQLLDVAGNSRHCSTTGCPASGPCSCCPASTSSCSGYQDRSLVLAPEHANKIVPGGNGVFKKTIVAGGEVVGTWARAGHQQERRRRARTLR